MRLSWEGKVMKYKCLKCEAEFDVSYEAICPNCRASGFDVEPLSKWKRAQAVA
jgi:Zn finger protein HypA/HybF involved in hydrogenase expression